MSHHPHPNLHADYSDSCFRCLEHSPASTQSYHGGQSEFRKDAFAAQMMRRKCKSMQRKPTGLCLVIGVGVMHFQNAFGFASQKPAAFLVSPLENKTAACRTNTSLPSRIVVLAAALLQTLPHILVGCSNRTHT